MMQREYKLLKQAIPNSDLVPDFSDPQSFEQKSWYSLWEEVALSSNMKICKWKMAWLIG